MLKRNPTQFSVGSQTYCTKDQLSLIRPPALHCRYHCPYHKSLCQ